MRQATTMSIASDGKGCSESQNPLGASLGDLLSQSRTYGGVGLGTIYTSIGFLTVIVALVAWVSFEGERNGKTDPLR